MEKNLFRQESIDHISSPEELHDYMRVTSPRLWMVLGAIMALLIGLIAFAFNAGMESTIPVSVLADNGYITSSLHAQQLDLIKLRMPVRIGEHKGYIASIDQASQVRLSITLDSNETLPDGFYDFAFDDQPNPQQTTEESGEFMAVQVVNGEILFYTSAADPMSNFRRDRRVLVGSKLGTVSKAELIDTLSIYINLDDPTVTLKDGSYDAEIVTEQTTPISFLLN